MKKIINIVAGLFVLVSFFAMPGPTVAIDLGIDKAGTAANEAGYADATETTLAQNIGAAIRAVLTITGVIFTALVFYAGFLWMNARGDDAQVEKAKDIIETSIIGLVIALASFGITSFVMKSIATKTTPQQTIPEAKP